MASSGTLSHGSTHTTATTDTSDDCFLAGQAPAMQKVRSQLFRIAPYVRMALIIGESGTGKQPIARTLHDRSAGANGPFLAHGATTWVDSLTTDAQAIDALREAHGGTLFLHRVCDLSAPLQLRLDRLLRLHDDIRSPRCDLRIIASSRRDLRTLTATGQFHEDLYRRIAAVEITLPPLRKRPEDIPALVHALLHHLSAPNAITPEAMTHLQHYPWPQNIRELQDALEHAVHHAGSAPLDLIHLPLLSHEEITPSPASPPPLERLQDVVQRHVLEVLTHCSGNKLRASEVLGISRSTLYRMLDTCTPASPR